MSILKLTLDPWLLPLPISLIAICIGMLFNLAGRRRVAHTLIIAGATLAVAATFGPVANSLLRPLETRYYAVLDASVLPSAPHYVAVLGSAYYPRPALPVTAALDAVGSVRLILSGGPVRGEPPIARGYALAAAALGVPASSMILVDEPLDTSAEIRAIHSHVGDAAVLLVTSAAHTPRAMALSRREGLHAIAAPTGNLVDLTAPGVSGLLPSGSSLRKTETAFHEYIGLLALSLGIT